MKLYTTDENFIKEVEDFPMGYTGMIEDQSGNKRWYVEGVSHRDNDLPAMIYKNGDKHWFFYGKRHREGGPAEILVADGIFTDADFANAKKWYVGGKLHRIDGPAVEYLDGTKHWHIDGKLHRIGGAAIEDHKGIEEWYFENKRHRLDGPAIVAKHKARNRNKLPIHDSKDKQISYTEKDIKVRADGTKAVELWFIDDKKVTEEACKLLRDMIRLKGLPNEKNK